MKVNNPYSYFKKKPIFYNHYFLNNNKVKIFEHEISPDNYNKVNYRKKYQRAVDFGITFTLTNNKLISGYSGENYQLILMNEKGTGYVYNPSNNIISLKKTSENLLILIEHEDNIYNTGYYLNY